MLKKILSGFITLVVIALLKAIFEPIVQKIIHDFMLLALPTQILFILSVTNVLLVTVVFYQYRLIKTRKP